jgi:hypothetical protein
MYGFPNELQIQSHVTYLEDPLVPRSEHSESLINVWRQMEAV